MKGIDPRVFVPNFAMQPELPPAKDLAPEEQPMDAALPEDDAFQSYQEPERQPELPTPAYGPRLREPQKTIEINRRPTPAATGGTSGGAFCTLYQEGENWFITGGPVRVNTKKSFEVPRYEVDNGTDGEWLLYVTLHVEVKRDDNGDYFMWGFVGSSDTSLEIEDSASVDTYPAGSEPEIGTWLATVTLEVGLLRVTDHIPKFFPAGCGPFIMNHCGGEVGYLPRR